MHSAPRLSRIFQVPFFIAALLGVGVLSEATPITIDFEGLPDSTILATQYPGLTFTNAIILAAGISLNEFEFPPHSGMNVVSDNCAPIITHTNIRRPAN